MKHLSKIGLHGLSQAEVAKKKQILEEVVVSMDVFMIL